MQTLRGYQADSLHALRSNLAEENWLPVVGYEGLYAVSDCGRVKSCERYVLRTHESGTVHQKLIRERILCPRSSRGRYEYGRQSVQLCRDGISKSRLISHLVVEAFIGPRPEGLEVAHNDGNASNNQLNNLRYATPRENTHDKYLHGTVPVGESVHNSKLSKSDVAQIRRLRGQKTQQALADEFGISISQVSRIQSRKQWGHV